MKKFTTLETDLLTESVGAQQAFDKSFSEAKSKIAQVEVALSDFKEKYQKDLRNWGYAGSMGYVNEQLDGILEHLGSKVHQSGYVDGFDGYMDTLSRSTDSMQPGLKARGFNLGNINQSGEDASSR